MARREPSPRPGIVYGRHGVAAALAALGPGTPVRLYLQAEAPNPWRQEIETRARAAGVEVEFRPRAELDRLAGDRHHQGCVLAGAGGLEIGTDRADLSDFLPVATKESSVILVLDGLEDPRNYGACLRAAAGFGCRAVVTPERRMAPLSGAARKAAAGTERNLPRVEVTNVAAAIARLQEGGYWVVGLDPHAPGTLARCDLRGPRAFVVGQEGTGLRRLVRERCDLLARIPLAAGVESLNVAVATGVALYEYRRQNDPPDRPRSGEEGTVATDPET
jgi:23S rRNA (guanosine2251-2'-O)-methyltransferase